MRTCFMKVPPQEVPVYNNSTLNSTCYLPICNCIDTSLSMHIRTFEYFGPTALDWVPKIEVFFLREGVQLWHQCPVCRRLILYFAALGIVGMDEIVNMQRRADFHGFCTTRESGNVICCANKSGKHASQKKAKTLHTLFSFLGIFFVLPCIETYQKVDLRTITLDVPPQEVSKQPAVHLFFL